MNQIDNAGMIADEDMAFLVQIVQSLAERYGNFRINLPSGAYFTNSDQVMATFPAVDQIIDARDKLIVANGPVKYQLIMPSQKRPGEIIGEILNMRIMTDPTLSPQQFIIKPVEDKA